MPVSHTVISCSRGYPAGVSTEPDGLPSHARFAAVSATLTERHPSKATVRYRPNRAPGIRGWPSGPASTSNNILTGAAPTRRRKPRSALPDGTESPSPSSAAVSLAHTPP